MTEQEAYGVLGWTHAVNGNDGNEWLAYRCPTPACPSEGVARDRGFGFGRCGICSVIMEVVDPAKPQPAVSAPKSAPARRAKPVAAANIQKELMKARLLREKLEELVVQRGQFPNDDRNVLLMAYWALIFDFHKGILANIEGQQCGSAFALVRTCDEALIRAHVAVKGSVDDVKKLKDDTYVTDFDQIGPWMDKEFASGDFFTNFIRRALPALHSFAHAGLSQIGRRFDGHTLKHSYDDGEIIEVIRRTTSVAGIVTNLATIHLGFTTEANQAAKLYEEWGKH